MITIKGREILPLRAIRFVTCGRFSADVLLEHLLHEDGYGISPLYAYRKEDSSAITPRAWKDFYRLVKALSEPLDLADDVWIEKSTELLPPDAFVWLDEFEAYWRYLRSFEICLDIDERVIIDRELSLPPYIPQHLRKAVWEGWEYDSDEPEPVTTTDIDYDEGVTKRKRHIFTDDDRAETNRKGALQLAVEAFLDKNTDGEWEAFIKFLNGKLQLPEEELIDGKQSYQFYFEKVNKNGVYMIQAKLGKKQGEDRWNHHSPEDVKGIIRKEKLKRKRQTG